MAKCESKKAARLTPNEKSVWTLADLQAAGVGSRTTVWRLLKTDPTFPRPLAIRGLQRWLPDEIREWLRNCPRATGEERGARAA
jgi:predicted DNA-binding transcriptional regulator AlpA